MSSCWKCVSCGLENDCSATKCKECFRICPIISNKNNKELLVFGFVRLYHNAYIPDTIVVLMGLWVWVRDTFNEHDSDKGLIFQSFAYNTNMTYETVRRQSGTDWVQYKTAIGTDVLSKGQKQIWKFQILQGCPDPTIVVGIIGDEYLKSVVKQTFIGRFYHQQSGYGISLYTSKLFHNKEWQNNITFPYAYQFNVKNMDTFSMILDLTQEKGSLSYIINAEKKEDSDPNVQLSSVAFDEIDIEQSYRCVVALYYRRRPQDADIIDIVALLPVI